MRQIKGVALVVVASLTIWGVIIWRASMNAHTQAKLCDVLYSLIDRSDQAMGKPGSPGYIYWRGHPDELRYAHQSNRQTLNELPCKPKP